MNPTTSVRDADALDRAAVHSATGGDVPVDPPADSSDGGGESRPGLLERIAANVRVAHAARVPF